jgi:hypothetical protein
MYNTVAGIAAVPAGSDTYVVLPTANSRAAPVGSDNGAQVITSFPSGAYYGYDLEKSSGILFQGVNTRSQPPFLNLNLAAATTGAITCNAWGYSDVVLQIDYQSKQVVAFI